MPLPPTAPGTVTLFTDIMCAWSTLGLHRFYKARSEAGLDGQLVVDHQLFLLEDINQRPWTMPGIEPEKPVVGALAEDFGFTPWHRQPSAFPVTSLPANEAVHAAKLQSPSAAEQLDMALRRAFWRDSQCVSLRHVILDVAAGCEAVDADQLQEALDDGRARGPMLATYLSCRDEVKGSPHFFLADGSDVANPGIALHQSADDGPRFPIVDADDPTAYAALVRRAADATD